MSSLEMFSLAPLVIGVAAVLRFVWLDSLRFPDRKAEAAEAVFLSPRTVERLVRQVAASEITEADTLPKAA